jgi:peroxiredoxin
MAAGSTGKFVTAAVITVAVLGTVVGGVKVVGYFSTPGGKPRTINLANNPAPIKGPKIEGKILGPDGQPVASAGVWVGTSARQASAYPGTDRAQALADKSGNYQVAKPDGDYVVVVRSPQGYAEVSSQKLAGGGDIKLQPWGRIEGVVKAGNNLIPRARVHLWRIGENDEAVHHETDIAADAQGKFVFPQVAPGGVQIYRRIETPLLESADWTYVEVEPGKTTTANIGGKGGSVVGKVAITPELAQIVSFDPKHPKLRYEADVRRELPGERLEHSKSETPEEYRAKEEAFARTPEGKIHKEWTFGSSIVVNRDGTFRIDNLPAAKYTLTIRNLELQEEVNFLEDVAETHASFEVPAGATPASTPIDLGTLTPESKSRLRPGMHAPAFSVKLTNGQTFNSADHAGKPIVIVFWGTGSNTDKLADFGKFAAKWGKDPRIVIVGCYNAESDQQAEEYIKANHLDFPHTSDASLTNKLDCSWPEAVVIGADGKLLQKHLHSDRLEKYVNKALGIEPPPATKKSRRAP